MEGIENGDYDWAEKNQVIFRDFWKVCFGALAPYGFGGVGKYLTLSMRGIDLGPLRWP